MPLTWRALAQIVMSDVVYDPELYVPLVATLAALVPPAPLYTPTVVLAFRHRNPEDYRFWAVLEAAGFVAEPVRPTSSQKHPVVTLRIAPPKYV